MHIELPKDQQAILVDLVAAGRYSSVSEAILEGVALLISREDRKQPVRVGTDQADPGAAIGHDRMYCHFPAPAGAADEAARPQ